MALDPLELVIIVGAIMIFFMWGPNKIPELARALGRAKNEYQKAAMEVEEFTKESMKPVEVPRTGSDDKIIEIAHKLGIKTEGKMRDEIVDEIVAKKSL